MSISTHFKPNIHQNGPEILGVKEHTKRTAEDVLYSTQQKVYINPLCPIKDIISKL
jgi:hypothetical protein